MEKAKVKANAERKEKEAAVSKADRALKKAQKKVKELKADAGALRVSAPRDGIVFYGSMRNSDTSFFIFNSRTASSRSAVASRHTRCW